MNTHGFAIVFGVLCLLKSTATKQSPPIVQVYSRTTGVVNKPNTLVCYVSNFHPPMITVDLLKNDVVIKNANQTEMIFDLDWDYYMTKYVSFIPQKGDKYTCQVTHMGLTRRYFWELDM